MGRGPAPEPGRDPGGRRAGRGQIALAVTDRRIVVLFPEHLLAAHRATRKAARKERGLLGQALGSVNEWAFGGGDGTVVPLWEADVRRLHGWSRAPVGRSFPFADVLRLQFTDGSVLYGRTQGHDLVG